MQAPCPNCGNRIVIDDSRVPDRAFSVRCPKCQNMVKFAGRTAAATPAPAAAEATPAGEAGVEAAREGLGEQTVAYLRRQLAETGRAKGQALVALPERALAGALTLPLSRIGYASESMEDIEDATRRLEASYFDVVIATRGGAATARGETLYQRIGRLNPDARRGIFVVLVGEEFRTGDGTQAFATMADLVVNPKDAASVEAPLLTALAERSRLYQVFLDTRKKHEATAAS